MKPCKVAITRLFRAPRARVFEAWTQARHLACWFGPNGFTFPSCEADARPGGVFTLCMRSPEGKDYWVRGVYREARPPERVVITCTLHDEHGVPRVDELIEVTLAERDGHTSLELLATCSGRGDEAAAMLGRMPKGWSQTIARLSSHFIPIRDKEM